MHLNSRLLFNQFARNYFERGFRVLEIGPTGSPSEYEKLIGNPTIVWDTIDFAESIYIDNASSTLTYQMDDPYRFPISDESYDIILSGQVIEHVGDIWRWLEEVKRVVRTGGIIITINPVSWPYHEAPIDCWRIFPDGIKTLASKMNLFVDLCLFDSLEGKQVLAKDAATKIIPGRELNFEFSDKIIRRKIQWNKFIRRVPFFKNFAEIPIEVSFDTISILRKV